MLEFLKVFNPKTSDIDFIAVVREPPTLEMKKRLISLLLKLDRYAPAKGFEMSVVPESVCRNFVYPTSYELHYSNYHRERAKTDLTAYCTSMNRTDSDLAAHFTVIKAVGKRLYGFETADLFGKSVKNIALTAYFGIYPAQKLKSTEIRYVLY